MRWGGLVIETMTSISTVDEYDATRGRLPSESVIVVHFSAPWCGRCPAFTSGLAALCDRYGFAWLHAVLPEAEELQERWGIAQLPATVVVSPTSSETVLQGTTLEAVEAVVATLCRPALVLDADF